MHKLAGKIGEMAPLHLNKVYFTSGGSEANESALKLARQYHRDAGKMQKHIVIGRWQSYHGNTIGALSAGGDVKDDILIHLIFYILRTSIRRIVIAVRIIAIKKTAWQIKTGAASPILNAPF